jgi:hypothetical protein
MSTGVPEYNPTPMVLDVDEDRVVPYSIIKEVLPEDYVRIVATIEKSPQYQLYLNRFDKLTFGKHSGMSLMDVLKLDPQYVQWLSGPNAWIELNHPQIRRQAKALLNLS